MLELFLLLALTDCSAFAPRHALLATIQAAFVLQRSGNMSASIASIEGYIRESEDSQGSIVTVLKQGYLLKRSSNIRKEWKRRFFVLDSLGMLYYYSNKVCPGRVGSPPLCSLHTAHASLFGIMKCCSPYLKGYVVISLTRHHASDRVC